MAAFMKSKLAAIQQKKDTAQPPTSPEDKKKKEEEERAKKEAEKASEKRKKEDEAAAKKKKEEEEKAKKEADKASKKELEKNATVTSKAAVPSPVDSNKKNWFSSVTQLTKTRSGSIVVPNDAPPPQVVSSARATPTSVTSPTGPSPSLAGSSPAKTRVAPATLGRSSNSGVPPEPDMGASRADKEAAYAADGVKWCEAGGNDIRVKAGNLPSLVKRLTSPQHGDPSFVVDFLLTYRSFTTPKSFLDQLIERFSIYPPEFGSQAKTDEWKRTVQTPVRLRVFNVIKTWVQQYWSDFETDEQLQAMLTTFINTVMATSGMKTSADTLIKMLEKKRGKEEKEVKKQWNTKPPQPILPINMKAQASLVDYDPQELARQMTLIDHEQLAAVKSYEFLDTAWSRDDKETRCPNLMKLIKRFNTSTFWVATEILQAPDKATRTNLVKHFILITKWLRKLNNYNGAFQVIAGLGQASVYRLKDVWEDVPKKILKKHEKSKEILSRDKAYERYRAVLRAVNPPCVPYLGLCLSDLLHLEEAHPHLDSDGLVNFDKRYLVAKIIRDIQGFQNTPYCVEQVFFIREFLSAITALDENELYQISLRILPKADRGSVHPNMMNPSREFSSVGARSTLTPPHAGIGLSSLSRESSSDSLSSYRDGPLQPSSSDVASSSSTGTAHLTEEEKQVKERLLAILNSEAQKEQLRSLYRDEINEEAAKMKNFGGQIGGQLRSETGARLDQWQKSTLELQTTEIHNAFDQVLNVLQLPVAGQA